VPKYDKQSGTWVPEDTETKDPSVAVARTAAEREEAFRVALLNVLDDIAQGLRDVSNSIDQRD
jgi:hypothetical protein